MPIKRFVFMRPEQACCLVLKADGDDDDHVLSVFFVHLRPRKEKDEKINNTEMILYWKELCVIRIEMCIRDRYIMILSVGAEHMSRGKVKIFE